MAATQTFTNSGLVSYKDLSPNNSGQRTMNIDALAIHTMAANLSVETCGALFKNKNTKASSNYGIGSDGRIALYVEEKNRAWTTSSSAVDNRAVTIEVASTTTKEPYGITDEAWDALIDLCTDICRRNDIKELKWEADKNIGIDPARQNMVVHRWYNTKKSCPGTFLYDNMGKIAEKVNRNLNDANITIRDTTMDAMKPKKIWEFLMDHFENIYVSAAIMGNLYMLSSLVPNNLRSSDEKRLGMDDSTYTKKVNSGEYKNFATDSAGYGLAMWANNTKKNRLLAYAKYSGKGIGNLNMQLNFLYEDMARNEDLMKGFERCTCVKDAVKLFILDYKNTTLTPELLESRVSVSKEFLVQFKPKSA